VCFGPETKCKALERSEYKLIINKLTSFRAINNILIEGVCVCVRERERDSVLSRGKGKGGLKGEDWE
jgi:hypothetical protein